MFGESIFDFIIPAMIIIGTGCLIATFLKAIYDNDYEGLDDDNAV